jgi:hypothetical protein
MKNCSKKSRYSSLHYFIAFTLLSSASIVNAKSCDTNGRLAFLGVTKDNSQSVWLSANGRVANPNTGFELIAAQGNQQVDSWSRSRPGLKLSFSPNVSNGNGGTHKLYVYDQQQPCLLDTQNQKGGITFPPSWPSLPPNIKPPTGITPTLPGGVKPPIGTLPPTGLMPTLPGGVKPPIGTLPPTGLMPTLPGGVKPPIGTLPPTGLMPTLPGGVKPPIGTLPPTGVMPQLPGGVTPPIGTLPPTGITPELPIAVKPPIGILPPIGITPELPANKQPPTSNLEANSAAIVSRQETRLACPDSVRDFAEANRLNCIFAGPATQAPLTAGRDFQLGQTATWNTWLDARYFNTTDERNDLDIDGNSNAITLGGDRSIGETGDVALGMMLSLLNGRNDGFSGSYSTANDGITVGPYLGYRLSNNWSLDTTLSYGQSNTDLEIAEFNGSFDSAQYMASSTATGQYAIDNTYFRPKFTLSYSYNRSDAYDLSGEFANQTVRWDVDDDTVETAAAESLLEINQLVRLQSGKVLVPYVEAGLRYDIKQPNDGEIVGGDLQTESVSRWTGTLRVGNRFYVSNTTYLEISAGYLSFAQNGLDVWEGRFYLSHLF